LDAAITRIQVNRSSISPLSSSFRAWVAAIMGAEEPLCFTKASAILHIPSALTRSGFREGGFASAQKVTASLDALMFLLLNEERFDSYAVRLTGDDRSMTGDEASQLESHTG
jgi:hypothetical protein